MHGFANPARFLRLARWLTPALFLSGLLLAAPLASGGLEITVEGDLQSKPFVDLTISMMNDFGVTVERTGYRRFLVQPQSYRARDYAIEGDATAAVENRRRDRHAETRPFSRNVIATSSIARG